MTDNIKNICIIGAGNVGIALAVDITQKKEFNVRILTSRAQDLPVVYEKVGSSEFVVGTPRIC